MKKRIVTTLFACFILSATIFSGCKPVNGDTSNDPILSEEDSLELLESAVPIDESGVLCSIANSVVEENSMQQFLLFQKDKLLSYCFVYDEDTYEDFLQLQLISLDSGQLLSKIKLPSTNAYAPTVQVCGQHIAVSNANAETLQIFDDQLKEINTYAVSGDTILVNPELTTAYCISYNEGLSSLDLESGEYTVLLDQVTDLTNYATAGNNISLRYTDLSVFDKKECYAGLNLETGNFESFDLDESFTGLNYQSGLWLGEMQSEPNQFVLGTRENPHKFHLELSYPTLYFTENSEHFLILQTDENGEQHLSAYNTNGTFLSSFSLEKTGFTFTDNKVWLPDNNGYLLTLVDESGHDRLAFWDFTAAADGMDLALIPYIPYDVLPGTALENSFYDKARTLSEQYGVTIKIADQCATDYSDMTALQELDADLISSGLQTLESALSTYPTDFWNQLRYGSYRTLEINLMGEISDKGNIEGYFPTAFVQQEKGKITIVLNINIDSSILTQNIYHESSHIIDKVLELNALYREDALYSEEKWGALNPESFISLSPENSGYFYSYEMMPMVYYQEEFTSYFATDYGKSYPTEDRATIFETAMMGTSQVFDPEVSPGLHAKLEYYCNCIRDCFDTSSWIDTPLWEAVLNE